MLNKHNLTIASLASKDNGKPTLTGLLVTPEATVETDSHQVIRITTPRVNLGHYPTLAEGEPKADFEPFILSKKDALDILQGIPKTNHPILAHAAVIEGGTAAKLVTTDAERVRVYPVRPIGGQYPEIEQAIPKAEDADLLITFDSALLEKVLRRVAEFQAGDKQTRGCRLYFHGPSGTLRVEAQNDEGQDLTAAVLPMTDTRVSCPLYEQRKKALELLIEFREALVEETFDRAARNLSEKAKELLHPKPKLVEVPIRPTAPMEAVAEPVPQPVTVPVEPTEPEPEPDWWMSADGTAVYDVSGEVIAKVRHQEGEPPAIGVRKSFGGDVKQLQAWIRQELAKREAPVPAAAPPPMVEAKPAPAPGPILVPTPQPKPSNVVPFERPADWDTWTAHQKAWYTRRNGQSAAPAIAGETKPKTKQPSLKELQLQLSEMLTQLVQKVGPAASEQSNPNNISEIA